MNKSATRERAEQLYAILASEAEEDTALWVGILQSALDRVPNLPKGSYSNLVRRLEETGCISTLSQGRFKHIPTTLRLNHPPNDETWFSRERIEQDTTAIRRKTSPSEMAKRLEAVEDLLGGLPMTEIVTHLTNRIEELSSRVRSLEDSI